MSAKKNSFVNNFLLPIHLNFIYFLEIFFSLRITDSNKQVGTIKISSEDRTLYRGPKGGLYYYSSGGNKVFVKPEHPRINL